MPISYFIFRRKKYAPEVGTYYSYDIAMRHQYTRAELESITQETAIYIEGTGIAQLQWGGLEIAEGCKFETKR